MDVLNVNGRRHWGLLWLAIIICEGTGIVSALAAGNTFLAYQSLAQPSFAPPSWVFGPAWVFLYLLMGIAGYRIVMMGWADSRVRHAMGFFMVQLALNFIWTPLFFRWQMRFFALVEIIILLVFIILTSTKFYLLDKVSATCMVPYIIWVSFAAVLTAAVWMLNR